MSTRKMVLGDIMDIPTRGKRLLAVRNELVRAWILGGTGQPIDLPEDFRVEGVHSDLLTIMADVFQGGQLTGCTVFVLSSEEWAGTDLAYIEARYEAAA